MLELVQGVFVLAPVSIHIGTNKMTSYLPNNIYPPSVIILKISKKTEAWSINGM